MGELDGKVVDAFGRVDAVLKVAGIGGFATVADLGVDDDEPVLGVNLTGVLLGTKHGGTTATIG